MTDKLIEDVARALSSYQCTVGPGAHVYRLSDGAIVERCADDIAVLAAKDRWNARAAILATLRGAMEPSEGTWAAAGEVVEEQLFRWEREQTFSLEPCWQAMLTQLIKEVEDD